jgi:cytoskeletal protein CcmA (bactofilin family)
MWTRKSSGPSKDALTTIIDQAAEIEGKCTFSGTVMMNGKCKGEIVSTDTLIIGETAVVEASVEAATLVVRGRLTGNIHAAVRVELRGKAHVVGDIETPVMVVEEGARFDGHCQMKEAAQAGGTVVPLKKA